MQDDNILVSRFQNKDFKAFDEIFNKYYKPIYYFVFKMLHNSQSAEDVAQDTFVKVFKGLGRVPLEIKLSPWIYKIAYNTCIDYTRKSKNNLEYMENIDYNTELQDDKREDNPEEHFSNKELSLKIQKTMHKLSARYKSVILLRDYNDLSYKEIAVVLELSETAVKSLIHRARLEFQRIFKEMD